MLARPSKVYDFTAHARRQPAAPPPGDRIDAQLKNHADAIVAVQLVVEKLVAAQTAPIDVEGPARAILVQAERTAQEIRRAAGDAAAIVDQAKFEVARIWAEARRAQDVADRSEARLAAAVANIEASPAPRFANGPGPSQATPALGYGAGGFYASDDAGAAAVSADYAQVAIEWAEHLPDTIPPNILAINAISGQHWSSRWWALRSASAFGMLAWWYMGAWPGPPPTTPLTPTGDPIPPGGMYFDTTLGMMLVWNGSGWVPLAQGPAKATTSSLYYLASAGQTAFPLSTADRFGHTFAFNQTATEGLQALVNGVRLEPTADFTVDTVASAVTFLRPLPVNAVVTFDILTPASQLAPSGSATTVMLAPIVPDGVRTTFAGLTVAATGHAVNVSRNEELLVSVDGVGQQPGASYNASADSITFAEAPTATANIFMVWFGPGSGGGAAPPGPPAPATLPLPDVTPHGVAVSGQTLSCSQGFWSNIPTSYAYQWMRGASPISGATAATYTLVDADAALSVSCVVTATNSVGSNSATSNTITVAPLNPYPATNLKALYAMRQLGAVANCVRVRRASDNAEQNIGYVAGNFDIASYNTFISGTQGFVKTWYDQSGAGLDLTQATTSLQPSLLIVGSRAHLTFEGHLLVAASSVVANGDHAIGIVGWSGTGAGQQIPFGDFGGTNGWFLVANNSVLRSAGYYSNGGGFQNAASGGMMAASPMRWTATRTSGALTVYLNGASVKTVASGTTNAATGSKLAVGGFGTTPSWQGVISEAFVYSAALTPTVISQIDASQAAYYAGLDLATPYAGGTASVQVGGNDLLSFGNILQKDQGAAGKWTMFGAIQIFGQNINAEVIFSNASGSPVYACYECWIDPLGQLRVRLINHFGNNLYIDVTGATPSLIDGKKHMIAASYDGTKPATLASIKMYVDGAPLAKTLTNNTLASLTTIASGQNFVVGAQQPSGPNLCGPISFFQLDNVLRNDAYIANYYPGSPTPFPPLDGANTDMRLTFSEGLGTSVHDTSPNAFVGTLSSSGLWVP